VLEYDIFGRGYFGFILEVKRVPFCLFVIGGLASLYFNYFAGLVSLQYI
jgi:hypothetical protein